MSNILVIRVLRTQPLDGVGAEAIVVLASDSYGKSYRDDWDGEAAFLKEYPAVTDLVKDVATWPELNFEAAMPCEGGYGIEIQSVSGIEVCGYPGS